MDYSQKMQIAMDEARKSLINREFPVGAVIFKGDEIINTAHSSGESHFEFLPHAEMAVLWETDKQHYSFEDRRQMQLFTTLEPCMMCLGAAMSFFVGEIIFALESPLDGATEFAQRFWKENRKEIPGYKLPTIHKGILRSEGKAVLQEYINLIQDGPLVEFSKALIKL